MFYLHRGLSVIFLLLYVDEIILTGNVPSILHQFIAQTHAEFAIKDLDSLNYFLGLEVSYTSTDLFVCQSKYAHDVLDRAKMIGAKLIATSLATGEVLVSSRSPFMILLYTTLWLVSFSISLLLDQTFPLLLIWLASSCMLLRRIIFRQSSVYFGMSKVQFILDSTSHIARTPPLSVILMLISLGMLKLVAPLMVTPYFSVEISSPGVLRSSRLCLFRVASLNNALLPMPLQR